MGSFVRSHKSYNKGLDAKFDGPARQTACEFLETRGLKLEIPMHLQPVAYKAWDFIIRDLRSGENKKIECEIKTNWDVSGDWIRRFNTLDIPHRKAQSEADCFIVINGARDTLAFINGDDVRQAGTKRKNTQNGSSQEVTKNEKFFGITLDKVRFFTKIEGTWKEFKL